MIGYLYRLAVLDFPERGTEAAFELADPDSDHHDIVATWGHISG